MASSPARDQTHVPCIGRWILDCWTTAEVLLYLLSTSLYLFAFSWCENSPFWHHIYFFPLCSNSKSKYVLLVSFQLLASIHISLCVCPHYVTTFVDVFTVLTRLYFFSFFSKCLNILTSLNHTIKWFYVNNSTIPMFFKHLGKCLVLSCLQFASFNLIRKEFWTPVMCQLLVGYHLFQTHMLSHGRAWHVLFLMFPKPLSLWKYHLFSAQRGAVKMLWLKYKNQRYFVLLLLLGDYR